MAVLLNLRPCSW